ncbi:metallophosphatase domain-containing protein [Aspergillus ruber CBS 135680]|uniref:Metallo-dependent phosphatase n=1 Tax=Aspergillus ruber (strain CBS 135680) TaxID=1388766 RepID=A0A017S805_ASPRC|nr:Metallo-dependent phosphatase [Aspergillus ruber CBS 135680]EYE92961.1 Metallo-dependent phosphatase [Aspergillus ruber CBS 135680]
MSLFGDRNSSLDALLHQLRPSAWQQFLDRPCIFLARKFYTWQPAIPAQPLANYVSIVCVSDTHNAQPKLPNRDILIHAGDLTQSGSLHELQKTVDWLRSQPHKTRIVIAGNHDLILDARFPQKSDAKTTITCDNGRCLRIYGSPYSPCHGNWAFQYLRSENVWNERIPDGIDILITHGPPRAHLDLLKMGCIHLSKELWLIRLQLHVFGHIHEGAGIEWLQFDPLQDACERMIASGGGIWNLVWTLKEFAHVKTLLVNPAIVGGFRDIERRQPIKVVV